MCCHLAIGAALELVLLELTEAHRVAAQQAAPYRPIGTFWQVCIQLTCGKALLVAPVGAWEQASGAGSCDMLGKLDGFDVRLAARQGAGHEAVIAAGFVACEGASHNALVTTALQQHMSAQGIYGAAVERGTGTAQAR